MSELAWQKIWETASIDEINLILTKAKISIPGFRLKNINIVPRILLNKLISSASNRKKIIACYRLLIDNKENNSFEILDAKRNELVNLLLSNNSPDSDEIKNIIENLDKSESINSKNRELDNGLKIETQIGTDDNLQKKYKTLERKMADKIEKYEKKLEEKTKNVNDTKRKISEMKKSFEKRIALLESENNKIKNECNYYLGQIDKLKENNNELVESLDFFKDENIKISGILKEVQNNYSELLKETENKAVETQKKVSISYKSDGELQDNFVEQEIFSKPNILVLGNVPAKQDKISCHQMTYIDLKEIKIESLSERCAQADKIIIFSWSITAAKQRKIRDMIPDEKFFQFDDYNAFTEYVKKEELKNIGSI